MATSVSSQNPFHSRPLWIVENRTTDEVIDLEDGSDDDIIMTCSGFPSTSSPNLQNRPSFEEVDGHLSRRHADFPALYRTHSFDANLFNIRQASPEKLAEQLTLIDLALLKSIPLEEFHGCKFEKKDRVTTAPNITKFSRRFNHTSFWVVRDILNEPSAKIRAEIITQFLRVARHLQELNNIHSLVAIVLAIESPPIHRLARTWKLVQKKEKQLLDKLTVFVSGDDNYGNLRSHMSKVVLPCIPHLGLHQKDLVYLDTLAKSTRASEEEKQQALKKTDEVYELIRNCQNSRYDALMPVIHYQKYLNSLRFIDELQKFYEEDNYKLSLQLEPSHKLSSVSIQSNVFPLQTLRNSKSQEDLLGPPLKPEVTSMFTPPRRPLTSRFSEANISSSKTNPEIPTVEVTEKHVGNSLKHTPQSSSKVQTLPMSMRDMSFKDLQKEGSKSAEAHTNNDSTVFEEAKKKIKSASPSVGFKKNRGHSKSLSVGTNVLTVFGIPSSKTQHNRGGSSPELPPHVSLLDDSFLEDSQIPNGFGSTEQFTPTISTASSSSLDAHSYDEESEVFLQDSLGPDEVFPKDSELIREGILKRRALVKNGQIKQLKVTHKYWMKLTERSIILLPKKYKDSPKKPQSLKGFSLSSCRVKYNDPSIHLKPTQFLIVDDKGNQTKFTASCKQEASSWVQDIREAIEKVLELKKKQEQEKPLIRL